MKVQKTEGLKALENAPLNLHMLRNHHACVRSWCDLTLSLPIALTTPRESTKKTPLQRHACMPMVVLHPGKASSKPLPTIKKSVRLVLLLEIDFVVVRERPSAVSQCGQWGAIQAIHFNRVSLSWTKPTHNLFFKLWNPKLVMGPGVTQTQAECNFYDVWFLM